MDPIVGGALLVAVGAVAAFVGLDARRRRIRSQAWAIAATKLGLRLEKALTGPPFMTGSVDGLVVRIAMHTTPRSSRHDWVTTYDVRLPPNVPPLRVVARRLFTEAGVYGKSTGDPVFDRELAVISDHDWESHLGPELRSELLAVYRSFSDVVVDQSRIRASSLGYQVDASAIVESTRRFARLAKTLIAVAPESGS